MKQILPILATLLAGTFNMNAKQLLVFVGAYASGPEQGHFRISDVQQFWFPHQTLGSWWTEEPFVSRSTPEWKVPLCSERNCHL